MPPCPAPTHGIRQLFTYCRLLTLAFVGFLRGFLVLLLELGAEKAGDHFLHPSLKSTGGALSGVWLGGVVRIDNSYRQHLKNRRRALPRGVL